MSIKPIVMIVPPELQDLPKTLTPESSASSSAHKGSGSHHSSPSKGLSLERTPSGGEGVEEGVSSPFPETVDMDVNVPVVAGWEGKTISGRLNNLRKAPQTLAVGFRFKANLHHEVVDSATSIKGYKRLEEIVRIYAVMCEARDTSKSNGVQIALLVPVEYHLNEVRISNDLAARLSGWRLGHTYMNYPTLRPDDLELKDRITDYVGAEGLVDLEALITPEVLAVHGFVDVANLFSEGARSSTHRQMCFDERPPVAPPHSSSQRERGSCSVSQPHDERRVETISADSRRRARKDFDIEDDVPLIQRRLNFGTQFGAVVHLTRALPRHMTQLSSEMANKAASAKSRADELANKVNRLKEELEKAQAEKESGIQATMDEAICAVDHAKRAEADRDNALNELNAFRQRVAVADQNLAHAEEGLRNTKTSHQRYISIAQAQGAKWLVGADMFKDVMAVASMNTTMEIYNDGEEFNEEGKSLASPVDTIVRLRWELNEDGVPIWPPSVLEEGEDFKNLPRFDSWVGDAPKEEAEHSSTPPAPQPITTATVPSPARADTSIPIDLTYDWDLSFIFFF
ncbi:hypothetical protein SLEP1_g8731 [Rubroshorea leprosula]|uniref:Uncharacterized protein n=1 Tax=Rubroshorea leprosula TaxID=152421 RepID=A0AAV5I2L7_9ROSI|nr:hypothetical protein SLEP1_g8731 [Rubroshorea leprosula]